MRARGCLSRAAQLTFLTRRARRYVVSSDRAIAVIVTAVATVAHGVIGPPCRHKVDASDNGLAVLNYGGLHRDFGLIKQTPLPPRGALTTFSADHPMSYVFRSG
jgi:hypothetical protein